MATPITTACSLRNVANYPATLQASGSSGAARWISTGAQVQFAQICKRTGSFEYDLGNAVKLLCMWNQENRVVVKIVRADTPFVWQEIEQDLKPNNSNDKLEVGFGEYTANAYLNPSEDGSKKLDVVISFSFH
ncbi:hypothetical protein V6N13_038331 [Hibiscus sabdariffa]|uniref:Uncharacterized protein n=1 Tax=Hibiscus sabdariffa TaxID=183260 RepID=A0ABR2S2F7_9ROSI